MRKDFDQNLSSQDLKSLVREGEHENQDFKYKISNSRKIARTLSSFANTSGGRLLVGVRDNGLIAGVKDEDDIYMIESAADIWLSPRIEIEVFAHLIDGKLVWEVVVPEGKEKPYAVEEETGMVAYYRDEDQNFAANAVLKEIWRQDARNESRHPVPFSEKEKRLIQYIKDYNEVTVSKASKVMELPRNKTIATLARLVRWEVISWKLEQNQFLYTLD